MQSTVVRQILEPAGVRPAKLQKVPLTEAIIEMVKAGHGVSLIPNWSALPYVRSGELTALRLTRKGVYRHWRLALRANQANCDYLLEFGNLLASQSFPAKVFNSKKEVTKSRANRSPSRKTRL